MLRRLSEADRFIAPLGLFVSIYLATSWALSQVTPLSQWAALIAVVYRYVRDELDDESPDVADDGTQPRGTGDRTGAAVVHEPVAAKAVVNATCLAEVAADLGVGPALLLGRGEDAAGGRQQLGAGRVADAGHRRAGGCVARMERHAPEHRRRAGASLKDRS